MKTGLWLAVAMVTGLAVGVILSGCDSAGGLNGLQVSPDSATLSSSNRVLKISAQIQSDLALPLQWSVSAPSLGSLFSAGSNAVYTASFSEESNQVSLATGNQIVTVKDQYGNEGVCAIVQQ